MKRISFKRLIAAGILGVALPLGFLLADDKGTPGREQESDQRELADRVEAELKKQLGSDAEFFKDLLRKAAEGGGGFKLELDGDDAREFLDTDNKELLERLKGLLLDAEQLDAEELQSELRDNPDARRVELPASERRMGDLLGFLQGQFESRRPGRNEKDHRSALAEWEPVVKDARNSIARVLDDKGKQVALATVVHPDGFLVTKASELTGRVMTCEFADGTKRKALRLDVSKGWDLALIKVDAKGLAAIEFAKQPKVELGSFLAAAGTGLQPVAIGVASVAPRNLSRAGRGFLGIGMENVEAGVRVSEVQNGTAAKGAGLKVNDMIVAISGVVAKNSAHLATLVGGKKPGDKITVRYRRGDDEREIEVELGQRQVRAFPNPEHGDPTARMSGRLSEKRDDFPNALQHDLTLRPEECGGPLLNLDGKAVGVNVARGGRVKSYAIPAQDLKGLLATLESKKFAVTDRREIEAELDEAEKEIAEMERRLEEAKKRREEAEAALKKAAE